MPPPLDLGFDSRLGAVGRDSRGYGRVRFCGVREVRNLDIDNRCRVEPRDPETDPRGGPDIHGRVIAHSVND